MKIIFRIKKFALFFINTLHRISLPIGLSKIIIPHLAIESYLDLWVVRPMNGQINRLRTAYLLSGILRPTHAIETGTYLGTTTQYLTSMVTEKTYSIEVNKKYIDVAKKRLSNEIRASVVELILGNSKIEIMNILNNLDPSRHRILVYLDAHWSEYVPLKDEIQSLLDWGGVFIAIIDDFMIPLDAGYGFDLYKNYRIDASQVPLSEKISIWMPSQPSSSETGSKRGTAYLIHADLNSMITENHYEIGIKPYI
jgi:predicted O-methyltransferase YrrM